MFQNACVMMFHNLYS